MYNNKGLLIVISGPSGAGKGTVCRELLSHSDCNLELSVSATTRKPREGETEGVSYFFKEQEQFLRMIEEDAFIEYARVYDHYYGTPKEYVISKLEEGKDVILEIDVQGAMKVKKYFQDAVYIFIMPPSFEELKNRIIRRGTESAKDIKKRMRNAYEEICSVGNYDYVVLNDDVKAAASKISCVLTAEKCRLKRCKVDVNQYKEE